VLSAFIATDREMRMCSDARLYLVKNPLCSATTVGKKPGELEEIPMRTFFLSGCSVYDRHGGSEKKQDELRKQHAGSPFHFCSFNIVLKPVTRRVENLSRGSHIQAAELVSQLLQFVQKQRR
jgi:hypothetical protein